MMTTGPKSGSRNGDLLSKFYLETQVQQSQSCVSEEEKTTSHFPWSVVRGLILVALSVGLIFAHGCHPEDVDDELFAIVKTQ